MNFIIRRQVKQMLLDKRVAPIVKSFYQSVLYFSEAQEIMAKCLPKGQAFEDTEPPRIIKRKKSQDYYWIRQSGKVLFAVKIGVKSEVFIVKESFFRSFFEEIPLSMTIEVPLKICNRQTKEDTLLFVSVFYDADERKISLQTLNIRGTDIVDFPHDYWNVQTIYDHEYACDGCCGETRVVKLLEGWDINFGAFEWVEPLYLWTGTKTLKIFKKEEVGYTIDQMLGYWKKFWKEWGY